MTIRTLPLLLCLLMQMGCTVSNSHDATGVAARSLESETANPPGAHDQIRLTVYGMTCQGCAKFAARQIRDLPGVIDADVSFEKREAVATVQRGRADLARIQRTLRGIGFEALSPGERRPQPLSKADRARLDFSVVSDGERFRLDDHLVPGKITIVDFHADWCGPCRLLSPKLETLALRHEHVALRKVDLTDSDSLAAKQAREELGMPGLPWVLVYDGRGRLVGKVQGNHVEKVEALIRLAADQGVGKGPRE